MMKLKTFHRRLVVMAEIATLRAMERGITIVGFYDRNSDRRLFLGKPVWQDLREAETHDARILTDITAPQELMAEIAAAASSVPLLVPDVLRMEHVGK